VRLAGVAYLLGSQYQDGAWLVKTVHMARLPKSFPPGPEWESFWVTLAFHTAK
jgi:hypothetical protein